jgi:hypothetical protein
MGVGPAALLAACVLYGGLSMPAPAGVGPAEAAVGLLVALAAWSARGTAPPDPAGAAAALWLAAVPAVGGAMAGAAPHDLARDLVALSFLFLCLVLGPRPARGPDPIDAGLCAAGALFALRWWRDTGFDVAAIGVRTLPEGPELLLGSSAVLFAAVRLPLLGVGRAAAGAPLAGTALAIAGAAPALALLATSHRAAVALAAAAGVAGIARRGARTASAVAAAGLAAALLPGADDHLLGALRAMADKTRLVGLNARLEETAEAFRRVSATPGRLLFGEGWGALLANPTVGGDLVRYLHGFVPYAAFKAGLVGAAVALAWLSGLVPRAAAAGRRDPDLVLACLPPLVAGLAVHTGFKHLCFGLVLALLVRAGSAAAAEAGACPAAPADARSGMQTR